MYFIAYPIRTAYLAIYIYFCQPVLTPDITGGAINEAICWIYCHVHGWGVVALCYSKKTRKNLLNQHYNFYFNCMMSDICTHT